jgi:hypothetical protein
VARVPQVALFYLGVLFFLPKSRTAKSSLAFGRKASSRVSCSHTAEAGRISRRAFAGCPRLRFSTWGFWFSPKVHTANKLCGLLLSLIGIKYLYI